MTQDSIRQFRIETERLRLRPLAPSDAAAIAALANNWNVVQHLALLPYPYGEHHATEFLSRITAEPVTTTFAICDGGSDLFIGIIGVGTPIDHGAGNFGYWLGEPYWGKGYATEASRAVVALCFDRLGAQQVRSACRPANSASRNVLEKCSFVHTGEGTMPSEALGQVTNIDLFTLTRDVWLDRNHAGGAVTIHEDDGCAAHETG